MSNAVKSPPDTEYFKCFRTGRFQSVHLPRGFGGLKLCPDTFVRGWKGMSPPDQLYISAEFARKVQPTFEPVRISEAPSGLAFFCWRPLNASVSWKRLYQDFPKRGIAPNDHQVTPWLSLQELAFGWKEQQCIVPKNDKGAFLMLGDAGVTKTTPTGATTKGVNRFLVQLGHYAMLSAPTWTLGLPGNEGSDRFLPEDSVIITVWPE